jgi:DNA repair exonuclease SbcCD nuclease subunit
MADCHLGAWSNHPELRQFLLDAFAIAIEKSISQRVDFILICGDLFDTSMPGIDVLKHAATHLRLAVDSGIRIYAVAGSHDFSPTGKSILSVLAAAGLLKLVSNDVVVDPSGALIAGIDGQRAGLEASGFEQHGQRLQAVAAQHEGFKIFAFHSGLLEHGFGGSIPGTALPSGFDYYATGHIHQRFVETKERCIVWPGPLFPVDFQELEQIKHGGFYIVDVDQHVQMHWQPLKLCDVEIIRVDGNGKSIHQVETELYSAISSANLDGKIALIKVAGQLASGKPADLDWNKLIAIAIERGAATVKRSVKLETSNMQLNIDNTLSGLGVEELEHGLIASVVDSVFDVELIQNLLSALAIEKVEGEPRTNYENRLKKESYAALAKVLGHDIAIA